MRFSEYLRKLDEGNYGHDYGHEYGQEYGQEAEAHDDAKEANRYLAKVKRDESTMVPEQPKVEDGEETEETPEEKAKKKKAKKKKAKKKKAKEEKLQLDWQIPSLREVKSNSKQNYGSGPEKYQGPDPGEEDNSNTNTNHKSDPPEWDGHGTPPKGWRDSGKPIGSDGKVPSKPLVKKKPAKKKNPTPGYMEKPPFPSVRNESDADSKVRARMAAREKREAGLSNTIANNEKLRKANESVERPMRDALGRLSIHSINEASKAKLKRKLKSGNTTYADKQAAMKQLKLKQADQKKRATKRAATEDDLSIAVRAGDAASESSVVLPGGDKPLKRSKLRTGSVDLQKHEDREADEGASREEEKRNTGRNRHLDTSR